MPNRHCALVKSKDGPQCRLGIWRVFHPWTEPHVLVLQGYKIGHPEKRPLRIEYHFRQVVYRLVRSLGRLYQHARKYDRFLEEGAISGPNPVHAFEIPEEAGIAADSVFHYLNVFIDDLARIIPFVLAEEDNPKETESFFKLKKQLIEKTLSAPKVVRELFEALDQDDSWWCHGFKYSVGIRQRLTHYTDLLHFSASTKAGDTRMTSDISLITIGSQARVPNFENALQNLLTDLCEWLDQLDQALLLHLSKRLAVKGIVWNPLNEPIPCVRLPDPDGARLDASHYLYLPVCSRL